MTVIIEVHLLHVKTMLKLCFLLLFLLFWQLTINSLVEFFKTAKGVDLEIITSATLSKLEEIKEKTASGVCFSDIIIM